MEEPVSSNAEFNEESIDCKISDFYQDLNREMNKTDEKSIGANFKFL